MKKLFIGIMLLFSMISISACTDQKYTDNSVNVIFFTGGTSSNATTIDSILNAVPGTLVPRPQDPQRVGYVFLGWFRDMDLSAEWDFDNDLIPETSIVIFAGWQPDQNPITFVLNGGEFKAGTNIPTYFLTGSTVVFPLPVKEGFTFNGWFLYEWVNENSTIPGDTSLIGVPKNHVGPITVHAHWRGIQVTVSFRANFPVSGAGPANPPSAKIPYGSVVDFVDFGVVDGYRFIGWNTKSDGSGISITNGDIFTFKSWTTLYAQWEQV